MHACMHTYMHARTHAHTHSACTHTHTHARTHARMHAHTQTVLRPIWINREGFLLCFVMLCLQPAPERWNQEGKTSLDLLEQEIVSGSGISWAICKSAPWPRHITTPAHHFVFYRLDALPAAQPTVSKHWRHSITKHNKITQKNKIELRSNLWLTDVEAIDHIYSARPSAHKDQTKVHSVITSYLVAMLLNCCFLSSSASWSRHIRSVADLQTQPTLNFDRVKIYTDIAMYQPERWHPIAQQPFVQLWQQITATK